MRNMIVGTSVRPGRLAILVDITDASWQQACVRIIEYLTRMWGGCGNIIVPTNGREILPMFWNILERFDPDYLLYYRKTGRDMEMETPEKFDEAYQIYLSAWKRDIGSVANENQAKDIRENLRSSVASTFDISPELQQEIKERLAPFYFEEWTVQSGFLSAGCSPSYPQTDVKDILREIEHPPRVLGISDARGLIPPLWWASAVGRVDTEFQLQLEEIGVQPIEAGTSREQACALLSLTMTRHQRRQSTGYLRAELPATIPEMLEAFPERFSMIGLEYYRDRSASVAEWREPAVAVAGTDLRDFAFYYCLSRMRMRVVWFPPSVTEQALNQAAPQADFDERMAFAYALENLSHGDSQRQAGLCLTSATLAPENLLRIQRYLNSKGHLQHVPISIESADAQIPASPIRHYEVNSADIVKAISLPDDGKIRLFETPLPRKFKNVHPANHRWLTEVRLDRHQLPRHYALGEATMGAPFFTTNEIRISSVGPTYFCPSVMIFGGATAEASVPRPDIDVLGTLRIFQIVAGQSSLLCSISDKGVYARNASEKFGGIDEIARFLRSGHGQAFIAAYRDKVKPGPGEYSKGCVLVGRRYHDLRSLGSALNDQEGAAELLDRLSLLGILHRGYALKCGVCRYADWHPFRDLTDSFVCRRCRSEQIFTKTNWLDPEQPQIYYQLDELTYLGLEHDMHVPLLAIDTLRRASRRSFQFVHELEYRPTDDSTGKPIEIDINCVIDGDLTIGEAKSEDNLGRSAKEEIELIGKYEELARRLCARRIVFATTQEKWRDGTLKRIYDAIDSDRFRVTVMTRSELYS